MRRKVVYTCGYPHLAPSSHKYPPYPEVSSICRFNASPFCSISSSSPMRPATFRSSSLQPCRSRASPSSEASQQSWRSETNEWEGVETGFPQKIWGIVAYHLFFFLGCYPYLSIYPPPNPTPKPQTLNSSKKSAILSCTPSFTMELAMLLGMLPAFSQRKRPWPHAAVRGSSAPSRQSQ